MKAFMGRLMCSKGFAITQNDTLIKAKGLFQIKSASSGSAYSSCV